MHVFASLVFAVTVSLVSARPTSLPAFYDPCCYNVTSECTPGDVCCVWPCNAPDPLSCSVSESACSGEPHAEHRCAWNGTACAVPGKPPAPPTPAPPTPGDGCCYSSDESCNPGQTCCKTKCTDPLTCSYTETGCKGKYGQLHNCQWDDSSDMCIVGGSSPTPPPPSPPSPSPPPPPPPSPTPTPPPPSPPTPPPPSPTPPTPPPAPAGGCCYSSDTTCAQGDVCCKSSCKDPTTCSYTKTGCNGKYGQLHDCQWNEDTDTCTVGPSGPNPPSPPPGPTPPPSPPSPPPPPPSPSPPPPPPSPTPTPPPPSPPTPPPPSPTPPTPPPAPAGGCCYSSDTTCAQGDVCCKSSCKDPTTCSYTKTGCNGKYGQLHNCQWNEDTDTCTVGASDKILHVSLSLDGAVNHF